MDEKEIRDLVEDWVRAVHEKNADAVVAHAARDILMFDLAPPLRHRGAAEQKRGLAGWFASFDGPVEYKVRDLDVVAGDDVAFSTSLNWIGGKRTNGERTDVWVRATIGYRKVERRWTVVHEHVSVPFYMDGSYKAAVDLKP
jgi:ketosteroid isomerase-like protein